MADVWRVTVGKDVQESESFTPLESILKKLVAQRKPFKVGFGQLSEMIVPAGVTAPVEDGEDF